MSEGPVYPAIPVGADFLTRLSYYLDWISILSEGRIHFLYALLPPAFSVLCARFAGTSQSRTARIAGKTLALLVPVVLLRFFVTTTWDLAPWQFSLFAVALLPLLIARRKRAGALSTYRILLVWAWVLCALPLLNVLATYDRPHDCERLHLEARVVSLVDFCNRRWASDVMRSAGAPPVDLPRPLEARTTLVSSDATRMFLSTGYGDEGEPQLIMELDLASRSIRRAMLHHLIYDGVCIPGEARCVVTVPYESALEILDENGFRRLRSLPLPFRAKLIVPDLARRRLLIPGSLGVQFAILDVDSLDLVNTSVVRPLRGLPTSVVYDALHDRITAAAEVFPGSFQAATGAPYLFHRLPVSPSRYLTDLGASVGLGLSPRRGELYAVFPITGEIEIVGTDDGRVRKSIRLSAGVRHVAVSEDDGLLWIGNSLTGEVHVVDIATRREIDRIFVGRRIRSLKYEPAVRRLFIASSNGFQEVDPAGILALR